MHVRDICHMPDVQRAMRCSRWKVWNLSKTDPEFPKPRMIAGKLAWFLDEIEEYKASRPRREYGAGQSGIHE